jgi:MarR family transcriptional regulator, transcriptional regulator for hemolysin
MTVAPSPVHQGRQVIDLSFLLNHGAHVLATRMAAAFAEVGLMPRDYCVLSHALSGEYTQTELAKLSDLDKTTMLNTLDYLQSEGYVERRPSPADRRARIIAVTPAGAQVVAAGHKIGDRVHAEVLDALPESQRQAFVDSMTRLVNGPLATPVKSGQPVRRPRVPG